MIEPSQPYAVCPRCQSINIGTQAKCLKCQTLLPAKTIPKLHAAAPAEVPQAGRGLPSTPVQAPVEDQATIAASRQLVLVVRNGPLAGQRFHLGVQTTLGSHPENTIVLSDRLASRRHAVIEQNEAGYIFTDLNSTNGSFVNDARCGNPISLIPGMVLVLGSTQIQVELG
jgi:hypothetical protein